MPPGSWGRSRAGRTVGTQPRGRHRWWRTHGLTPPAPDNRRQRPPRTWRRRFSYAVKGCQAQASALGATMQQFNCSHYIYLFNPVWPARDFVTQPKCFGPRRPRCGKFRANGHPFNSTTRGHEPALIRAGVYQGLRWSSPHTHQGRWRAAQNLRRSCGSVTLGGIYFRRNTHGDGRELGKDAIYACKFIEIWKTLCQVDTVGRLSGRQAM